MKTIKQWLEELPEPYRTNALNEVSKSQSEKSTESLSEAILCGFLWEDSEDGYEYWDKLHEELIKQ